MTCGAMRMLPPWSTKVTPVTCPLVQLTAHIRADHCRAASQLNVMRRLSRYVVLMPPQGMVCAVHTTLGRARRSFPREHVSLAFAAQHDLDAPDLLQAMRPAERTSRARLATVGVGLLAAGSGHDRSGRAVRQAAAHDAVRRGRIHLGYGDHVGDNMLRRRVLAVLAPHEQCSDCALRWQRIDECRACDGDAETTVAMPAVALPLGSPVCNRC